jgi:hypothetical protein
VPVDQAQLRFDERLRAVGPAERMRVHSVMHRQAFELVWAAADRAGPMTELERAPYRARRFDVRVGACASAVRSRSTR